MKSGSFQELNRSLVRKTHILFTLVVLICLWFSQVVMMLSDLSVRTKSQ